VLGILAAAVVGLAVALVTRRGGGVPVEERRRRLGGAIASWGAQGWAVESETADSAVLYRQGERMMISVDDAGRVSTHPLQS
jgi:hypothetical protein